MSKKKYNKQVKEGWTNMPYDLWKLTEKITKKFFKNNYKKLV